MIKTVSSRNGYVALVVVGLFFSATLSPAFADVTNIEIINTGGALVIAESFFLPANDPEAHFSIATLGVQEEAGIPPTGGTGDPNDLWWDLEIKITRDSSMVGEDVMISIDKDVLNLTPFHWTDFHMTLGAGVGDNFVESDENDFLFFKDDPAPDEKTGAFEDPPEFDDPIAPDNLWWFADPPTSTGVPQGATPVFWLGINIPDFLFQPNPTMATFTLRQHASIPEPTTLGLLACGFGLLAMKRRA